MVDVESAPLQQVVDQLDKLVNVVEITELHPDDAREAELLLVTVSVDDDDQAEVEALATASGGKVVDAVPGAVTVMLAADPVVVDDFEDAMREHGIVELQRTGRIALS